MTGCLFNQFVYCMAIFTIKTGEDLNCYLLYMPIPCNNMVNSIENANVRGSCGSLRYPAVIKLTLVFAYRDNFWNVGFILSKPLGRIDFPMCPVFSSKINQILPGCINC